ncbi:MAG: hypothetical protein LQ339_001005 [Xanthoria mediterranea]|nr:MAG: hypothetical protein LQ339_001005 [Xanthoria mediterranea]
MGQESSTPVDESTPPQTLNVRSIEGIASYIKEGRAKKIVLMVSLLLDPILMAYSGLIMYETGAGLSTAAGIPDFRSPDTGIYANLARLDLPYPEAVFDISYFRSNPLPFYNLAHELYPGQYKPTLSHYFLRLLSDKGLLLKLFTQNIDCLERAAGVPGDKIIEAHGSFARQRCIDCRTEYPDDLMKQAIQDREVPHCMRTECRGLVKPDIVFFGEALPEEFHHNCGLPGHADLAIIMGTSLSVHPFASLPGYCAQGVPRLLINSERVGGLGSRADDVLLLGDCDDGVRKLASALGWLPELEAIFKAHNPDHSTTGRVHQDAASQPNTVDDEIAKITKEVDDSLRISDQYAASLRKNLSLPVRTASGSIEPEDKNSEQLRSTSFAGDLKLQDNGVSRKDNEPGPPATNVKTDVNSGTDGSEHKASAAIADSQQPYDHSKGDKPSL